MSEPARAAVLARDLFELVTRPSCNFERAGRERDLDLRAEQLRPGEPVPTLLRQCLRDAGRRRVLTPLREPQQRKAGLGVHAELGRALESAFGHFEITEATANLADLVQRSSRIAHVDVLELVVSMTRLALRIRPRAAELEHLRPVDAAQTWERGEGMTGRPGHAHVGPLGSALEVAELFASRDQAAVHLAGDERAELAFGRREHGLVEEQEPFRRSPLDDQDASEGLQAVGVEVGVTTRAAELERALGAFLCAAQVTAPAADLDVPQEQLTTLRAVPIVPEGLRGTAHPSLRDRRTTLEGMVVEEAGGDPDRSRGVTGSFVRFVGQLASGDALVELSEPPGGFGEILQRFGVASRGGARTRQGVVGRLPVVATQGVAPLVPCPHRLGRHVPCTPIRALAPTKPSPKD